jgi:esterase/lipase superfamily enzyme
MGTRVVIKALHELRLKYNYSDIQILKDRSLIGQVFLVGSDFDRDSFDDCLQDGLLDISDQVNLYLSGTDKALGMSRLMLGRNRLGQTDTLYLDENEVKFLNNTRELVVIDVTGAQGAQEGSGHAYFRKSPWVSSDILITMYENATPEQRKLTQKEDGIWTFSPDYIQSIKDEL